MGFCTNCGTPTDRPDNICPACASNMAQDTTNQPHVTDNYDNLPIPKKEPQRAYWKAIFDHPTTAYEQLFKEKEPENDFDLGEYKKKFNIGACFFTTTWLAFNCNFWCAVILWIALMALSSIPLINLLMLPLGIALMVYFGLNGNEITWKTRPYKDLEHFKHNQKMWAWAVPIVFVLSIVVSVGIAILFGAMLSGLH